MYREGSKEEVKVAGVEKRKGGVLKTLALPGTLLCSQGFAAPVPFFVIDQCVCV